MSASSEVIARRVLARRRTETLIGEFNGIEENAGICNILVVDDDPAFQRLIQRTLEPGAQVFQELDGNFEFDLENVDVVILDYQLPGADGLSLLSEIRSKYPELPVLFMTGFGDLEIARKALAAGANEYLPKPFQPDDLRAAVSRWVDRFKLVPSRSVDALIRQRVDNISPETPNFFTAINRKGRDVMARVVRYNARSVVVEVDLDVSLELGEELASSCLTLGSRSMEIAGAHVVRISVLSDRNLIEIELPGIWKIEGYDEDVPTEEISRIITDKVRGVESQYSRFDQGVIDRENIPLEYRATVTDLVSILQEIYDDLESCQSRSDGAGTVARVEFERGLIEQAQNRFFPAVSSAMDRFERAAESAGAIGIKEEFQKFSKRALYPLLLCSPFISRVIHKPIGVPGDYGILGQILGNPFEGHSLFGRLLNGWVLSSHPAKAYRHRVSLLGKTIDEAIKNASQRSERPKILSMASGVAFEVQEYIKNCKGNEEVDFELEDFSHRTLDEARRQFAACRRVADPDGVKVNLHQSSVIDLAKQAKKVKVATGGLAKPEQLYHFVYCAGLFDYLSDRLCRSVTDYLYTLVEPGGVLIVSNYTPVNTLKNFMDFVLDWPLIYRSADQFGELVSGAGEKKSVNLETDSTGAEVYAIIRKTV